MTSEGQRDVWFLTRNVGSVSGFLQEPDTSFANRLSSLGRKCRECQVFLVGESCGEIEKIADCDSDPLNPLIIRDLNDAGS
jgi:hypothetical protein